MKKLKEYEEEVYKCSRCGLCQSVCPVYKASLNECAVSRGKFNILNGIIKGELSFTKRVKTYLDLCTGCNACKDFCPSNINAKEIFTAAKAEYYNICKISFTERILNSYTLFKLLLLCARIGLRLCRLFKLDKVVKYFEKYLIKTGYIGKRIVLFNSLAIKHFKPGYKKNEGKKAKTAIYFEGCFNKYINSETKDAVVQILADSDIEFVTKNFECCGVSYLNDGNLKKFTALINKNIKQLNTDFDYIVTDCASCEDVLKQYKDYSNDNKSAELSAKTISITELLKSVKFKTLKPLKVSVHKPCHDTYDFIEIVKNIEGIEFIQTEDFDKCCGFSGKFALQNQEISREISKQKAQNYINSATDFIITTCPACLLGLNQGLAEITADSKPEAINLFVFIAKYCRPVKD